LVLMTAALRPSPLFVNAEIEREVFAMSSLEAFRIALS
jgi:hypothetical protein